MKKHLWLKIVIGVAAAVLLAAILLVVFLTVTEYRPEARQDAELLQMRDGEAVSIGKSLTIYSWNIGYAGLGASSDFFMDGGSKVSPTDDEVAQNLAAIQDFIASNPADAWLLQEVDVDSARTGRVNELEAVAEVYPGSYALAYNYKCALVPYPLPPIGRVSAGIATLTSGHVTSTPERVALPCPFSWPIRTANLKRCLLITRLAVEGSERELVLVDLHLEAYDDGDGNLAQARILMEILQQEYERGNYVIAGGDFNRTFPGMLDAFPVRDGVWTPGVMENDVLPEGFTYAFDGEHASCRLLDSPLSDDSQLYVLDGFIVSPNVRVERVEAVALGFEHSDHEPVRLSVTLLP